MRSVWMAGCGGLALLAAGTAGAQVSANDDPTANAVAANPAGDTIIVNGYRASIAASLQIKQDAAEVVDAIVAEDIGDFPQSNMSEAIQRISGVQIRRDYAGGVGNEISVRGLPPEYTQVTINGQSAPTNAEDRTFNFNILPAELFRKVEVFKSPSADMDEGGLGGAIALETIRPLDLKDRTLIASAEGVYNDITEHLSPRANVTVGRHFGDRLGVVVGLSYSEFANAAQSYDAVRWTRRDFDADGDGTAEIQDAFLMDLPRLIHEEQQVRRIAATGAVDYQVTDTLRLEVDGLYVDNRQDQDRLSPIWFFDSAKGLTNISVSDGIVEYAAFDEVTLKSENNTARHDTETYQLGLRANWQFSRAWTLTPFVFYSRTKRTTEEFRYYADVTAPAAYDIRQDDNFYTIVTPVDLTDPAPFVMSEARHTLLLTRDKELSLGFDATGEIAAGLDLALGVKYRDRKRTRNRFYTRQRQIGEPFAPVATILDDFLKGVSGPNAFAYHDFDKAYDRYGRLLDLSTAEEPQNFFNVQEQVSAAYAKLAYQSGPWLANMGVRVVRTDVTSRGSELDEVTGALTDREVESSYTDALPSLNVRYELADALYLRGSAARVLARPSLSDLAAYRVIDDEQRTISARNPELDPLRATQFDLAVEWYFAPEALLSAGYFYKDIESFIARRSSQIEFRGQTYTLTQPINGNNATVQGVELNYQQPFTFLPGFLRHTGLVANYTYTDSNFKETVDGGTFSYDLPENSKHSFNLIGYYEDERFSLRFALNFRDKFLREVPNVQDGLKYRKAYAQTDVSARYHLLPNLTLTVDVLNALNAKNEEYVYDPRMTDGHFRFGRTVQAGLRASF